MKNRKYFVHFENCYGIQNFEHVFEFRTDLNLSEGKQKKAYLIYAPNGSMKTSFTNTFQDIKIGDNTKDFFYPNRETKRIVKYNNKDGEDISPDDILAVESYIENYEAKDTQVLLANRQLKKEYIQVAQSIDENFKVLTKELVKLGIKNETENSIVNIFKEADSYYDCLEILHDKYFSNNYDIEDYSNIKYSDLVNEDAEIIFHDREIISLLKEYFNEYNKLISNSKIFSSKYNHNSAENSLKTLEKDGFFEAHHRILLSGEKVALDKREFEQKLKEEKEKILNEDLSDTFNKIDQKLSKRAGTRKLRDFLAIHKDLLPMLHDYEEFKKKLVLSYLNKNILILKNSVNEYKKNKKRLNILIKKANQEKSKWEQVVEDFNSRFNNMPFQLEIENKADVIFKSNTNPSLKFKYSNRGDDAEVAENDLKMHLSNGEKKALYLLNILFEIEIRKEQGQPTFLILDDIADSFDYRNKYTIIEYIKDIIDDDLFYTVILTHNFDFYRTLALRLELRNTSYFAIRNNNGILLKQGKYFSEIFSKWKNLCGQYNIYTTPKIFIAAIAFVRNLIEYTVMDYKHDDDYKLLTSLLHYKKNTETITVGDVIDIYCRHLKVKKSFFSIDANALVKDLICSEAKKISSDPNVDQIMISNKIVLSIAIRLHSEKYMINQSGKNTDEITENQTRKLMDAMTFNSSDESRTIKKLLNKVLLITSSNIHLNSFMYEPIIDISLEELQELYNDVIQL